MNKSVEVDGEINAGWNSYYNSDDHGNMSKTIGGTTEDDKGELKTEWWPGEIDADPAELNENQRDVIRYVVLNDVSKMSLKGISKAATPSMSEAYANSVLRSHWPEKHNEIINTSNNQRERVGESGDIEESNKQKRLINSAQELERLRQRLLDGETTYSLADEYGSARSTISDYANGMSGKEFESDCDIPPLEWNGKEHVISNESNRLDEERSNGDVTEETRKSCGEYHPLPCGLDKKCAFETEPNQLETALDAIEATARTEETKKAVAHLRGLL